MVDAADLKSAASDSVRVQVPPSPSIQSIKKNLTKIPTIRLRVAGIFVVGVVALSERDCDAISHSCFIAGLNDDSSTGLATALLLTHLERCFPNQSWVH